MGKKKAADRKRFLQREKKQQEASREIDTGMGKLFGLAVRYQRNKDFRPKEAREFMDASRDVLRASAEFSTTFQQRAVLLGFAAVADDVADSIQEMEDYDEALQREAAEGSKEPAPSDDG